MPPFINKEKIHGACVGIIDELFGYTEICFQDSLPLGMSEEGRKAVVEVLRTADPKKIAKTIHDVCSFEHLDMEACNRATDFCLKAVKRHSPKVVQRACDRMIGI